MSEQHLLAFLLQVVVLVVVARAGGELAIRLGIAPVVGELALGICIGPSLLGRLWPAGFASLFPSDALQRGLLEMFAWVGVIFLVLIAGVETHLDAIRKTGRAVITAWIGGFLLPFMLGLGLGWVIPGRLMGPGIQRPVFALFVATALSISAVPVIVRILMDLDQFGTRVATVIVSAAMADDTVGWIILGVVNALVARKGLDGNTVAFALGGTGLFIISAFTVGQRFVSRAIAGAGRLKSPFPQATIILAIVFIGGAVTQAIHVHLVLGVFVAGVLIARTAWTSIESETI
ncbi:MAG: cation:proton antiporter, partial [Actinomycetota bacterium]